MLGLIWSLVLVWNVATVAVYGFDKWRSTRNGRRVRERTLLWMLFTAGWPGAWLAMGWFRHKTQKQPFRRYAIVCTIVNPFWALVWWSLHVAATAN